MALSKADLISLIREKLASGITIPAINHRVVEEAIVENIFTLIDESNYNGATTGDIKEVACSTAYIAENFETSGSNEGRGKLSGERYGWAICNGNQNNGAIIDKSGRVSIGVGNSGGINYVIGATGGEDKHKLIASELAKHKHEYIDTCFMENYASAIRPGGSQFGSSGGGDNDNGFYFRTKGFQTKGTTFPDPGDRPETYDGVGATNSNGQFTYGGDQPHNNMQPYIVTLFIQKIETPYL